MPSRDGITFPKDKKHRDTIRNRKSLEGFPSPRKSAQERNIERKLTAPVSLSFANAPLRQVIEDIRGDQGINIYVDEPALAEKGISLESPVTMHLDNIALKSGLKLLLDLVHLHYVITDDVLKITTEEQARGKLQQKVYQVTDLVIAVRELRSGRRASGCAAGHGERQPGDESQHVARVDGAGCRAVRPWACRPAARRPTPTAALPAIRAATATRSGQGSAPQTHEDMLIKLITSTIQPRSWAEQGGPGTIDSFPLTMALVINQTPDIQEQVAGSARRPAAVAGSGSGRRGPVHQHRRGLLRAYRRQLQHEHRQQATATPARSSRN